MKKIIFLLFSLSCILLTGCGASSNMATQLQIAVKEQSMDKAIAREDYDSACDYAREIVKLSHQFTVDGDLIKTIDQLRQGRQALEAKRNNICSYVR
jgi:lipase chaperone LimK